MCIPALAALPTLTQAALAVNTAIAGFGAYSQYQSAKAQETALWGNYHTQQSALNDQANQINSAAQAKEAGRQRQGLIERGRLRVASGESGLAGLSMSRLLGQSMFNQGYDISSVETNRINQIKQNRNDLKSAYSQTVGRVNQIQRPSIIGTGLQIAGMGLNAVANAPAKKV